MWGKRAPRTDIGTVVLHWAIVVCLVGVILTGLRIASDEAPLRWLTALDAGLPRENLWYWHLLGALCFTSIFVAYIVYIVRAKLTRRVRLDATRLATLWRSGPVRWGSAGVVLLWILFGALVAEIVTGVLIFLGQAGWAAVLHRHAVWICLAFPALHVLFYLAYGGTPQLLRMFRPTRLTPSPPEPDVLVLLAQQIQMVDALKRGGPTDSVKTTEEDVHPSFGVPPMLVAVAAGTAVVALGFLLYMATATTLSVPSVSEPPTVDGDISDAAWVEAPLLMVVTDQGANFGGSGESVVTIRAVHDAAKIYFAFTWDDPTRSYKYLPLTKSVDGWHVAKSATDPVNEERLMEDKFSVLLSRPTIPLLGPAIHLSSQPIAGYPQGGSGRGLHFVAPGSAVDVWLWRADHGGLLGYLDDAHFVSPLPPTPAQLAGKARYQGGFANDAGNECFIDNYETPDVDGRLVVAPLRLPKNLELTRAAMGPVDPSPEISEAEGTRWWMTLDESVSYSAAADAQIGIGTTIPSILLSCLPSGDVADVSAMGRWSAGRWTLETARDLKTASSFDVAIVSNVLMWVSAFDHAATRHTRHIRAITLKLE